jgi:ribosomal protein S18 acetylase RimI-like enzyme
MFTVVRADASSQSLARQALAVHGRRLADGETLAAFLRDRSCYLLMAIEHHSVVGSLRGYALRLPHRPEPQFLLYEIDVRPNDWRRGIGKALLDAFKKEAKAAGSREVWTVTNASNAAAMALYGRCGFVRSHSDDVMLTAPV